MGPDAFSAACIALVHRLADVSGEIVLGHFRKNVSVDTKTDASPVTIADRDSEAKMRELIRIAFPSHGIIGEEHGEENPDAEWVWVLDPIDGTKSFIHGVPLFGTLIALMHKGAPWLGCINHPALRERWVGGAGQPTTLNHQPCHTRPCPDLKQATIFTTDLQYFKPAEQAAFDRLCAESAGYRTAGMDCFGYAMLAAGWTDVVCEHVSQLHDFAALVPVIEGAGGVVTHWSGKKLKQQSTGHVLACGDRATHTRALAALNWTA